MEMHQDPAFEPGISVLRLAVTIHWLREIVIAILRYFTEKGTESIRSA